MGRAAPDLPDPLENAESAPSGGADDLLSQLAGDEIDRLLAEADAEAPPPTPPAEVADAPATLPTDTTEPAAAAVDTPAAAPAINSQLDKLFNALNEPPPAPPAPPADAATTEATAETPTTTKPATPTATELDDQLTKLADELLPAPEPVEALTPVDATAVPGDDESAAQPEAAQEAQAPDERAELLAEPPADAPPEELYEDEAGVPAPWYLLPLVWLNAPFASLSDGARDRVGKVALATLLFSITVLTFLVFTRHHL